MVIKLVGHLGELVNEEGPLLVTVPKLKSGSVRTASQIWSDRRTEPDELNRRILRDTPFWVNHTALYDIEADGPRVYIGSGDIIFNNLEEAVRQLKEDGNYRPPTDVAETFKHAAATVSASYRYLRLLHRTEDISFLSTRCRLFLGAEHTKPNFFPIAAYTKAKLLDTERQLIEYAFEKGKDFNDNMRMIIEDPPIFLLTRLEFFF